MQPAGWALSPEGISSLRGEGHSAPAEVPIVSTDAAIATEVDLVSSGEAEGNDAADAFADELAVIDAVLARWEATMTEAITSGRGTSRERDTLVYDLDWDEDERLEEWREALHQIGDLPLVLQAIAFLDAWSELSVLAARALAWSVAGGFNSPSGRRHHRGASRRFQSRPEIHPRRSQPRRSG